MGPRGALLAGCATLAGVCAAAAPGAFAPADVPLPVKEVCFQGRTVAFEGAPARGFTRWFRYGPWQYGARGSESRPNDKYPNLYIVVPGTQHHSDAAPEFDHNTVVNSLGTQPETQFDVYFAVVLDPDLKSDLRDERDLLLEAQNLFPSGDALEIESIPGHEVLARHLKVESVADLARFRRKDGRLPRLVIVPAGASVRGAASEPPAETKPPAPPD